MSIEIKRTGYGQVEPNHLSAQYTGQIYAQLPAKVAGGASAITQLEQGQFLKYNYAGNRASTDGNGEWMLVYCEEKNYDVTKQNHKDFVLKNTDFTDKLIYPRLFKTNIGDIYTTNMFGAAATGPDTTLADANAVTLAVGNYLQVTNGILTKVPGSTIPESGMVWQVVKETTMPDGTNAVKIQRVQ